MANSTEDKQLSRAETVEGTIFKYAQTVPKQLLSANLEPNSIPVRSFLLALENLITQLNQRLPPSVEKYFIAASYKFSAPHRHQIFWRYFRQLKSLVCKYNSLDLLKLLNDLHKKMSSSIAQSYYYMPTAETLCYIGSSYLHQLYTLEKLRDSCIKTADTILGYLDIGHWQNLGLFILGLCGDVFNSIPGQTSSICRAYDSISDFITTADRNFPKMSSNISVVASHTKLDSSAASDPQRVLKLLKFTEAQMDDAILQDELSKASLQANNVLKNFEASMDFGIEIKRDDVVMKNTADLEGAQLPRSSKKKKMLKRKTEPIASSTPIVVKKKKRTKLNLSISSINTEVNETPIVMKKKKLKKKRKIISSVLDETSFITPSKVSDKKKKKQKI